MVTHYGELKCLFHIILYRIKQYTKVFMLYIVIFILVFEFKFIKTFTKTNHLQIIFIYPHK